jgi:hypothetical protein
LKHKQKTALEIAQDSYQENAQQGNDEKQEQARLLKVIVFLETVMRQR